jgi:Flp pilus assembly protein TadD
MEALEAMSRAEKLAPDDPQIVYGRAAILAQAGRYQEAQAAAMRALELRRNFGPAKELLQRLEKGSR